MSVSSTTTKNSYSGDGSTVAFAYGFRIFAAADLEVIIRSSTGTETTKTLTTHYSVSGVGEDAGGTVTFVTAPVTGETVVIRRNLTLTQGTDYVENDPFPANSHEDALDRLTFITQGIQEELDRAIKASKTNTISSVEFTISAANRANKIFAFDGSGDLSVTQELGTFRGNWATATSFSPRDIVKDTSNNNIYIANTAHTSSGSQPISSNADVAKWDLLVDAASATTSQTAAAASATAAASSATAAASSASASATSESNSASSASAAASSASSASTSAASASADLATFQGIFHGASASDPTTGLDAGDLYFNTSSNDLRVYNGSAWQVAAVSASGLLVAANNLSDLANAATARTNLGLVIGTDVQAFDAGISATPLTEGLHTIFVPAAAMRPTVSNGCASITDVETTAGRPDLQVLDFDATADEHAQFQIAMPKSWDEGTITFQVWWTSTATDTDGVSWALQGVACSDGDTADVAYGTAVVVDDANQSTAEDVYVSAVSGAVTIAGTPAAGDICFFRIFRDVSDANDTATEDARLIGVQILYTINAGNDA